MSNKLKALLQLIGLIGVAVATTVVLQYVGKTFSTETLVNIFDFALIGGMLYMCYTLILARLDYQEKYGKSVEEIGQRLDKMNDKG
jgi:hypothetical protein